MMVVNGEADLALYAGNATYKWDSCAGEAIMYSLKGKFTNQFGSPIIYNSKIKN